MVKKIIALVLISAAMSLGLLAGCISKKPKNIVATALLSKNILELPIKGIQPNAPEKYNIDMNIEEMFSIISREESFSSEIVNGSIFISKDNGDDTKDYFLIRKMSTLEESKM